MVKVKTIGMIEKNAKNEPTVKAHADLKNGTIFVISSGVTAYPSEGTSGSHQTKDLYIALNSGSGDERFTDFTIKKDDFVILWPNDAHKPQIQIESSEKVKKIVLKIAV